MSTPSRFKKDKEIIAEYESQVKGKRGAREAAPGPQGRGAAAAGRAEEPPRRGDRAEPPGPFPRLRAEAGPAAAVRAVPVARTSGRRPLPAPPPRPPHSERRRVV